MDDLKEIIKSTNQDFLELALILIGIIVFWFILWKFFYKKPKKNDSAPVPPNSPNSESQTRSTTSITIENARKPDRNKGKNFTVGDAPHPQKNNEDKTKLTTTSKDDNPPRVSTIEPEKEEQSQHQKNWL